MSDLATLIPLKPHLDHRGSFTEVFRTHWAFDVGVEDQESLIQASICISRRGVLRGMHRHERHIDLWHVVHGVIQVGLRRGKRTEHFVADSANLIMIPVGTWHGFFALKDTTLLYLQDSYYDPSDEAVARWDSCGIAWHCLAIPTMKLGYDPILSDRDRNAPTLEEVESAI